MSIVRTVVITGSLVSTLAACDSFRGAQQPIDAPATTVASATRFAPDEAILAFYSADNISRKGLTPRQYRDQIVTLRLLAIDARYQAFVQELRGARSGVGLGADLITLILGGVGTFVAGETTKSVLAAGTAVVAGARTSFDKNLFYDQTLPAIVAQMDAERNRQLLVIRTGLAREEDSYSLPDALFDLSQLERLGSIETAIKRITESATSQAKQTSDELQTFQRTKGFVAPDMAKLRTTLLDKVGGLDDGRAIMAAARVSGGTNVFHTGAAARQYLLIKIRFETDDLAGLKKISDQLQ